MPDNDHTGTPAPPVRLRIRLLGAVDVVLDGQRLEAFNSQRLQRFLALLLIRDGPQSRANIAYTLWPDSNEGQARTNLRKLLHEFRQAFPGLEEFITIDNNNVQWRSAAGSEVDVLKLRDALATGDLDSAIRLYRGEFMPSCYGEWIARDRDELKSQLVTALNEQADHARQRGLYQDAIRFSRQVMELEPSSEAAALCLMRTCIAMGDRPGALRAYHRHAEVLARELEMMPGQAVEEQYREIRLNDETGADNNEYGPLPGSTTPIVGREAELDALERAWKTAQDSGARLALIIGEPGIGKSRLAAELGHRVRTRGDTVANARAYEAAGRLPWGPIVELLRAAGLRERIASLDRVWRTELARLLPELEDKKQSHETEPGGDVVQRHRLFDAISHVFTTGEEPLLLIIDDLQWCDTETIELIGYIIRNGTRAPLLIVGTARWEEVPEHHPLLTLVEALQREQRIETLPLTALNESDTTALATGFLESGCASGELATRLWQETEGNPLFIIETLRAGVPGEGDASILTPTMRSVLKARLEQLSPGALRLAEVAAVIGRSFSTDLLLAVTETVENELIQQVDELWQRRIFRELGVNYDFSHDKLRAVALELISSARRRQLHRAVAGALVVEYKNDSESVAPRVAAHYDQAGMIEPAVHAYQLAAGRATAVSAVEEAVGLYRRALTLLAELPPTRDRDGLELEIRLKLGAPLVAVDGYGAKSSHQLYERAMALCRKLNRTIDPPILRGLGLARLQGCRFADCSEMGQALVDNDRHDPVTRTEGHYLLGVSSFWQGHIEDSRHHLSTAIDSYKEFHRNVHLSHYAQDPKAICLVRLGWAELWAGNSATARERCDAALELATEIDHLMTQVYVYTYAAIAAAEAGDLERLGGLLDAVDMQWQRVPDHYLKIVTDALRNWLMLGQGTSTDISQILHSVSASRREGENLHLTYMLLLLARARLHFEEYEQGIAATREALDWTRTHNQGYLEPELLRVESELAYGAGDADHALACLDNAVQIATDQGAHWLQTQAEATRSRLFPDPAPD